MDDHNIKAPVIVSASRSTDIPAFYASWFINRLKAGYVIWYNPFNQTPFKVSFKNCKVVVFWTKNPKPIIPHLKLLDEMGIHYYFHYTLNNYENEHFEPHIPSIKDRINTFIELSDLIGPEKLIWRFDPIIVTPYLRRKEILARILEIGNQIKGYTNKLVFSFIDINVYQRVKRNLVKECSHFNKETIENSEITIDEMQEFAIGLSKIRDQWRSEGWDISLATCAEMIDLGKYNIGHNHCIDSELMKNIFSEDRELLYYLNYGKLPDKNSLFFDQIESEPLSVNQLKDKGQRSACGCMNSKDIGMYNTCNHLCIYCYANASKDTVIKNSALFNESNESIIKLKIN